MLQINMPRGDRKTVPFRILHKNGELEDRAFTQIYMTVKKTFSDKRCLFQKILSEGTIVSYGDGTYSFTILPEDTDGLSFGKYVFDIELIVEDDIDPIKKTFTGELILEPESTYAENETAIIPNSEEPDEPTEPDESEDEGDGNGE